MKKLKVYHNPRCSKSRQALAYMDEKGLTYDIVRYLDHPLSKEDLTVLLAKIGVHADGLLRKNEQFYKANMKGLNLTSDQILDYMLEEPKLIERPIIESAEKAVIGRPTEAIDELL
jgi:arsenate reductase